MSRRSDHSREELRELIISSATDLVMKRGYENFSARELAVKINYSAGTIYNIFMNLHELIVHVEIEVVKDIEKKLSGAFSTNCIEAQLIEFSKRYLSYITDHYNLWVLLIEDKKDRKAEYPKEYFQKYTCIIGLIEKILEPIFYKEQEKVLCQKHALLFWKGLNGIILFSGSHKLAYTQADNIQDDVTFWVKNFYKTLKV